MIKHVILSGGIGSRLWPLSRKSCPKQYIEMFDGASLFDLTIQRNQFICQNVTVVGNIDNHNLSQHSIDKLGINADTIIEVTPRNTAAAICFAALNSASEDILIITPSDHIIGKMALYQAAIEKAIVLAKLDNLVTFGIQPTYPEVGYGYIEFEQDNVINFREKPDLDTAKSFLKKGTFLWNSGMFCFKAGIFLEELKKHAFNVYEACLNAWEATDNHVLTEALSMLIPAISVDVAVMEKSDKIKVVYGDFEWSDLGSFEALYDYLLNSGKEVDQNGNMVIGTNTFTIFEGMDHVIFVSTPDANLIIKKEDSQKVKNIHERVAVNNPELV